MQYSRTEVLKIAQLKDSNISIFHSEGLELYKKSMELYDKVEKTRMNTLLYIDFEGVVQTSYAFLNALIGKLVWDGVYYKVINCEQRIETMIKEVEENAEKSNPNKLTI